MRLRLMHRGEGRGRPPAAVVVAYVEWSSECAAVRNAYRQWTRASAVEKRAAFDAYEAALDREEDAASRYAQRMRRAGYIEGTGRADQLAQTETGYRDG
jgi:hypothetical protein